MLLFRNIITRIILIYLNKNYSVLKVSFPELSLINSYLSVLIRPYSKLTGGLNEDDSIEEENCVVPTNPAPPIIAIVFSFMI